MAKPGPKSANDLLGPIIPGARPSPPDDLLPDERACWDRIVGSLPTDWFPPASQPLLKELCRHIGFADWLAQDMARLRGVLAKSEADPKELRRAAIDLRHALRAHGYQSQRIVSLSTKLKLTQRSRYARADAAYAGSRGGGYPPPWEDWRGGKQ